MQSLYLFILSQFLLHHFQFLLSVLTFARLCLCIWPLAPLVFQRALRSLPLRGLVLSCALSITPAPRCPPVAPQ